jgi:hypothetical protein
MKNLAKVKVMLPKAVERKIDDLLAFDARLLDAGTARELLRLMPGLVDMRHAWRAHYQRYGCLACPKTDPTIAIAARLRRRGSPWAEIYEIIGVDRAATTRAERKPFEYMVRYKLARLDNPPRGRTHDTTANPLVSHNYHSAAGLCDKCCARLRRRLSKFKRKMHAGHDAKELTDALTRQFDVAQVLLNGNDAADFAIGSDLRDSRSRRSRT